MNTKYLGRGSGTHLRKNYRKKNYAPLFYALIALFIFGLGVYLYGYSRFFGIKKITISAAGGINEVAIESTVASSLASHGIFLRNNGLLVYQTSIKQSLEDAYPDIGNVELRKDFLHGILDIKIFPKEEVGIICDTVGEGILANGSSASGTLDTSSPSGTPFSGTGLSASAPPAEEGCRWFDKNGFLFKEAPDTKGSLVLKIVNETGEDVSSLSGVMNADTISRLALFKKKVREVLNIEISYFIVPAHYYGDLLASVEGRFSILFDPQSDFDKVAKNINSALGSLKASDIPKIDRIDATLESKIYVRYR